MCLTLQYNAKLGSHVIGQTCTHSSPLCVRGFKLSASLLKSTAIARLLNPCQFEKRKISHCDLCLDFSGCKGDKIVH